jgi:CRISPR-associated protein Cmr2
MLDGDGIGEFVRRTTESEGLKQFSSMLASFALQSVPAAIQSHLGTLVYAGGDDVLALLPASKALSCAHALAEAFQSLSHAGRQLSCSGSVVVAHYKANLRDVLNQARRSEKQAKEMRREANDDCGRLAITVLRRSGEHSTAVCPWDEVRLLSEIVNDYRSEPAKDRPGSAAASDRWAYQFRRELEGLPERADIHQAEFTRYLNRLESPQLTAHCQRLRQLWEAGANRADATKSFLHLVQSASFLARAGKE